MLFFLYCNFSTLRCTADDFDNLLKENTVSSIQIDNNSWVIEIKKTDYSSFLGVEEDFYTSTIEPLLTDESIVTMCEITKRLNANLPKQVHDFIATRL